MCIFREVKGIVRVISERTEGKDFLLAHNFLFFGESISVKTRFWSYEDLEFTNCFFMIQAIEGDTEARYYLKNKQVGGPEGRWPKE